MTFVAYPFRQPTQVFRLYADLGSKLHIVVARSGVGNSRLKGHVPTGIGAYALQYVLVADLDLAGVSR